MWHFLQNHSPWLALLKAPHIENETTQLGQSLCSQAIMSLHLDPPQWVSAVNNAFTRLAHFWFLFSFGEVLNAPSWQWTAVSSHYLGVLPTSQLHWFGVRLTLPASLSHGGPPSQNQSNAPSPGYRLLLKWVSKPLESPTFPWDLGFSIDWYITQVLYRWQRVK